MKPHTTHFDDCGCLSERLQNEIEEQARLLGMSGSREAKLLVVIEAAREWLCQPSNDFFRRKLEKAFSNLDTLEKK